MDKVTHEMSEIIVSLTSYPARIDIVNQTVETLLNQSMKADKVILWLAEEQFPHKEKDLPQKLLELTQKGLTIEWCNDIKSYKKLIPTLKKYPSATVVTADDDVLYQHDWLEILVSSYAKNHNAIQAHRVHRILFRENQILPYEQWGQCISDNSTFFNNFFTGIGGVLYPAHCFDKEVFNEKKFMYLCPYADDIWFWAMAAKNNVPVHVVENCIMKFNCISGTQDDCLWQSNVTLGKNDIQLKNVLTEYPEIREKLDNTWTFERMLKENINMKNTVKSVQSYKIFKIIPFLTIKKRGWRTTYMILGIPLWKVCRMGGNTATKYYLCGIPIFRK